MSVAPASPIRPTPPGRLVFTPAIDQAAASARRPSYYQQPLGSPTGGVWGTSVDHSGATAFPLNDPTWHAAASAAQSHVDDEEFGPQPTSTSDLPSASQWASQLGQAVLEVIAGIRVPAQVVRWTTPEVHALTRAAMRSQSAAPRGFADHKCCESWCANRVTEWPKSRWWSLRVPVPGPPRYA